MKRKDKMDVKTPSTVKESANLIEEISDMRNSIKLTKVETEAIVNSSMSSRALYPSVIVEIMGHTPSIQPVIRPNVENISR